MCLRSETEAEFYFSEMELSFLPLSEVVSDHGMIRIKYPEIAKSRNRDISFV